MSATAAERITSLIEAAISGRGAAAICLTGGNTPDQLYECLADSARPWRGRIDWTRVHLFWGDERNVPPDRPESNFGLANRTLIQHVRIPASNVHRIRGELAAVDAGRRYDAILHARRAHTDGALFDVMLLGIGANAHIASIFPHSPLFSPPSPRRGSGETGEDPPYGVRNSSTGRQDELATGVWVPELTQWRITLTPAALLDSHSIIVLAAGSTKADAIAAAIKGDPDVTRYPAQLLRDAGDRVEWIVDQAAIVRS